MSNISVRGMIRVSKIGVSFSGRFRCPSKVRRIRRIQANQPVQGRERSLIRRDRAKVIWKCRERPAALVYPTITSVGVQRGLESRLRVQAELIWVESLNLGNTKVDLQFDSGPIQDPADCFCEGGDFIRFHDKLANSEFLGLSSIDQLTESGAQNNRYPRTYGH